MQDIQCFATRHSENSYTVISIDEVKRIYYLESGKSCYNSQLISGELFWIIESGLRRHDFCRKIYLEKSENLSDEILLCALKHCIAKGAASALFIQKLFSVGYVRACKIMERMESMGYIASAESNKQTERKVLITMDEFDWIYNRPKR